MQDLGKLILRIMVGGLLIFHGIDKILNGTEFVAGQLTASGLPEFLQYGIYVGEVAAPALLIVGFFTRISGLLVAGTMAMAVYLTHMEHLDKLTAHGGWVIELPVMFLLGGLAIALIGPGALSVDGKRGKAAS